MYDSFLKENGYFIFSHVYVCMPLDMNCSCLQRPGVTDPKGAGVTEVMSGFSPALGLQVYGIMLNFFWG